MRFGWFSSYNLVLALWVGGMTIFTFVVTPAIFRSFDRDAAGAIVGKLFPGYFLYTLVLATAAFILFFMAASDQSRYIERCSFALLVGAICVSLFVNFKLQPAAVSAKQQVSSFEREAADSPARKQFSRMHAVSASLNLLVLLDGVVLLLIGPAIRR